MTDDIIADLARFLRARYQEDRAVAVAASYSSLHEAGTESGERWEWQDSLTDEPIAITPDAYLAGALNNAVPDSEYAQVILSSKERYRTGGRRTSYVASHSVILAEDEVEVAVADHIARQSPAYVIADIDAKCTMLDHLRFGGDGRAVELLKLFAARYREHPDWQSAWLHS